MITNKKGTLKKYVCLDGGEAFKKVTKKQQGMGKGNTNRSISFKKMNNKRKYLPIMNS